MLGPGGAIPIEPDADERAVMLVGGEADIGDQSLGLYELTVLRPESDMTLSSARGGG